MPKAIALVTRAAESAVCAVGFGQESFSYVHAMETNIFDDEGERNTTGLKLKVGRSIAGRKVLMTSLCCSFWHCGQLFPTRRGSTA
jgi:hypothetical protein